MNKDELLRSKNLDGDRLRRATNPWDNWSDEGDPKQVGMMMEDMEDPKNLTDIMFAALANTYVRSSWKSRRYFDGDEIKTKAFLVGIDTPKGIFARFYTEDYWDLIHVQEIEVSQMMDLNDISDADRLLSLELKEV